MYSALIGYNGENSYYLNTTNSVIQYLNFTLTFQNENQFQVKIFDANNTRWEIPNEAPFPHADPSKTIPLENGLAFVEVNHNPFWFKVTRKDTQEIIFDSSIGNFIFSDYYIEISTPVASPYLYGLGERGYNLTLGPSGIYTIWNADYNQNIETGEGGHNSYGSHPVYLMKEKSGKWSMTLLRNVNAMDVILKNSESLTYKITGGILDFNFFLGNTDPESAIMTYHNYLGGWAVPPFWSLGYQQSRWGYNNLQDLQDVIDGFNKNNLPLDVIWSDIDYMYQYLDFIVDKDRFPYDDFKKMLETTKKRWVPIVDAGIGISGSETFQQGVDMDVYIKAPNGTYVQGYVWPGNTTFVDWFHPNASAFWDIGLKTIYDSVPFSGLWLDMNEISNLIDGEIGFVPNLADIRNALPYTPGNPLYTDAIRLDAQHYNGQPDFNTHSLFHFMECNVTYNYLKTINKQPFILSRSNMFGSGKFANHWTGDNNSSWTFLQLSIPAIMNFNIFGIPMTGSDICGFKSNTTEELCSRWMQLGLLYPFSRNHAENDTINQEPWAFGPTLLETSRVAINTKYLLLKYYYSLFISKGGSGTVFRPAFFEFPDDETLMNPQKLFVDREFLLGKGLLAAPVVTPGVTSVDVYFPADRFFDFFTGEVLHKQYDEGSIYNDYPAPLNGTVPLFVRGGHIVQTQNTKNVMRSDDLDNTYELTIALKEGEIPGSFEAQGKILGVNDYSENNVYDKCIEKNCMLDVQAISVSTPMRCETEIVFTAQDSEATLDQVGISSVQVYGCFSDKLEQPNIPFILNQAYLNGQPVGKTLQRGGSNDVYDLSLSLNNQPIFVKSGDVLEIVSQFVNYF